MGHLAQQIEYISVRFIKVNPQTVQRYEGAVGETAPPLRAATLTRSPTAFLANVTTLFVKRKIFDMNYPSFLLHLPTSNGRNGRSLVIYQSPVDGDSLDKLNS